MSDLTSSVLKQIDRYSAVDSHVLAAALEEEHQAIVGIIKSLQCFVDLVEVEQRTIKKLELTTEGNKVFMIFFYKIHKEYLLIEFCFLLN